jgi:hypothetical protein
LNYTPVAVGIVLIFVLVSWFAWAHTWFTGPIRQIEAERQGIAIDEPGAYEDAQRMGKLDNSSGNEAVKVD